MWWNNAWFWVGLLAVGIAFCVFYFRRQRVRKESLKRLQEEEKQVSPPKKQPVTGKTVFLRWKIFLPIATATAVCLGFLLGVGLAPVFAVTFGLVAAIIAYLVVDYMAARYVKALETQLADSIDLMVSSLRAGAGLLDAMENAVRAARRPLKPYLEGILVRIRYGENPKNVLGDLGKQIPLESFQLFSLSQSVQWEVGGSLASTLASVGNFIRSRLDIRRRVQTQTTQTRVSIIAVVAISYFVGLLMWRNDPPRMESFLNTTWGMYATAIAILLQAVGLIWVSRLSRIRI